MMDLFWMIRGVPMHSRKSCSASLLAIITGTIIALALPPPSFADPPPWAPAWGYRAKDKKKNKHKHKAKYREYDEVEYERSTRDYGIDNNTCNREAVGAILGGAVGGAVGSQFGKGDGKVAAAVAGTIIGVIVGKRVGRTMDEVDQKCTGQVLERADTDQTVSWNNPDSGVRYSVTPTNTYEADERFCRNYVTRATIDGRSETITGSACREEDGTWRKID
jgi:surface antigen